MCASTVTLVHTDYDVLGVDTTASADDIKTAFRKQAKALHPDVNKSEDSEEEFMRVKEVGVGGCVGTRWRGAVKSAVGGNRKAAK